MRSKHLLLLFIVISGLSACTSNSNRFTIIGNIANMPVRTVVLEQLNNDVITIIDSERTKQDGHFELSGIAPEPGLYRLHFHPGKFILLSIDKGNIKIDGDWNALENYTVTGSVASQSLKDFVGSIREHLRDFNSMSIVLDTLQARGNDSILAAAKKDFEDMRLRFTQFVEHYADTTAYEANAIFAVRILNPASEKNYMTAFTQSLDRRFPNAKMSKDFTEYRARSAVKQNQPPPPPPAVGNGVTAPNVSLPDLNGTVVSLASFRGKYVLLDFWASWCHPCRMENPNVVAAWEKYKNKNFAIFGVSLDNNKDAWQKAIKDDGLTWTQVSDLRGWSSAAASAYNIQSIPSNVLIDPNGKIIGRDLRGDDLEEKLAQVLK